MKIFFASAENKTTLDEILKPMGAKNLLMSYYYLYNKPEKYIIEIINKAREFCEYLFLDSGAHTFLAAFGLKSSSVKMKSKKVKDPIEYLNDYLDWLKKYGKLFDIIVEPDIGEVIGVGYDKIKKWRKECIKLGLLDKLVVVSHYKYFDNLFGDWKKEWERLLKEYRYVAIGDAPTGAVLHNHFVLWNKLGQKNRVHGFAETKPTKLKEYPYWSVDSTSWQCGSRYGILMLYDKAKIIGYRIDRKNPEKSKGEFAKLYKYLDNEIKQNYLREIWDYSKGGKLRDQYNIRTYMKIEEDINNIWLNRGMIWK